MARWCTRIGTKLGLTHSIPHSVIGLLALTACGSASSPPAAAPDGAETTVAPPSSSGVRSDLGAVESALAAKNYPQAKRRADEILTKHPENPQALYYAGVAAEGLGDPATAEARYRKALAASPSLAEAAINLAALLVDQKRPADAITLLRPIAEKMPNDPLVHANLAAALFASGDARSAVGEYEKSLAKGGGTPVRLGLAEAKETLKDHAGALHVLREGQHDAEKNREQLAALALAFARLTAFDDAVATMDRAIRLQPSAELLTYRGLFQRSRKDLTAARKDFQAATEQAPDFAPAYLYLGEVAEEQKKPDDARKSYEIAVKFAGANDVGKRATARLERLNGKGKEQKP